MDEEFEGLDFAEEFEDDPIELARLSEALADREARLAATREELAGAREEAAQLLSRYRESLLAAEPDLPADLLTGKTLGELEESREAALALVREVRRNLGGGPRVPAGSPARETAVAPSSAGDKIRLGLSLR